MSERVPPDELDLQVVARAKLVHVLGERRGDVVMAEVLAEVALPRIGNAEELYLFAQAIVARGSFAGTVGGLLTVHALPRGARGEAPRS